MYFSPLRHGCPEKPGLQTQNLLAESRRLFGGHELEAAEVAVVSNVVEVVFAVDVDATS
jgi:hypothetical protein